MTGPYLSSPVEAGCTLEQSAQSTRSWSTGSLPQQPTGLEVEQTVVGRPKGMVPPAEVDGGPTTAMEWDRAVGLTMEYRPADTWAERPP
jgi:hypothetical protein